MNEVKEIGGYFNLELQQGQGFHLNALSFNSCRNCLEFVLSCRQIKKIFLPLYTCDVIYEPALKLGIDHEFYQIDENLEPLVLPNLNEDELFLYTNYFGLKQDCVERLYNVYGDHLVVDNAQAFFAPNLQNVDTYYAARKFFGVADGAYLYFSSTNVDKDAINVFPRAVSYDRMSHLLKRYDLGANGGYRDFQKNDYIFAGLPIQRMSHLTEAILCSVDYKRVKDVRRRNYEYLDSYLSSVNEFHFQFDKDTVPMVYPLLVENASYYRDRLLSKKIYVAKYWPDVNKKCLSNSIECKVVNNLLPLPIDQRYGIEEMQSVINCIVS